MENDWYEKVEWVHRKAMEDGQHNKRVERFMEINAQLEEVLKVLSKPQADMLREYIALQDDIYQNLLKIACQ